MANVYPWPPVVATLKTWNLETPISRSYGMIRGRRFASAGVGLPRRISKVTVHSHRNNGLGHLAALERLLAGGINLVRLSSCRMAIGKVDEHQNGRSGSFFSWRETSVSPFGWRDESDPFVWFDGASIAATVNSGGGGRNLTIAGQIPPGALVALPGEFLTVYTSANPGGETHMITNTVRSNTASPPAAIVKLASSVSGPGRVDLNTSETGIFELNSPFPDLGRTGEIESYVLTFREIFPSEVAEGLVEVNPWT